MANLARENNLAFTLNETQRDLVLLLVAVRLNDEGDQQNLARLASEITEELGLADMVQAEIDARNALWAED